MGDVVAWLESHPTWTAWLVGLSALCFVAGLIAMPLIIARMRPDHFVAPPPAGSWRGRHPAARLSGVVLRNAVGWPLLFAGIAMLVLPGQGIITILVALSLVSFPGKRWLELRIVRQRHVRQAIRWIRARSGRPPLVLPPRDDA